MEALMEDTPAGKLPAPAMQKLWLELLKSALEKDDFPAINATHSLCHRWQVLFTTLIVMIFQSFRQHPLLKKSL